MAMAAKLRVDIQAVEQIIRDVAEEIIMPRWRNLAAHEIGRKSAAGDIVTIADREAEAALASRLTSLLPGSRVVGEEGVAANPALLAHFRDEAPLWVVDPIDGTRKFAEGQTVFDVLVALVWRGEGVAGWIYAPAEDTLLMGEIGAGVVRRGPDGNTMRVTRRPISDSSDLHGIVSPGGFANRGFANPDEVAHRFRGYARHTCAGHNYARLLAGESDFLINFSTLPWDHLAGLTLVREAGFHAARHDGRRFDPLDSKGGLLIAPDRESWQEILAALLRPA